MTIFIHGPDGYRRTKRVHNAIEQFLDKYPGTGVRQFDVEEDVDWLSAIKPFIGGNALFSRSTLAVLSGALSATPKQIQSLVELTKNSKDSHLVLVDAKAKLTKPFSFLEEEEITTESFQLLTGKEWETFVLREAKKREVGLTKSSLSVLLRVFSGDSWGVVMELETLSLMSTKQQEERLTRLDVVPRIGNLWGAIGSVTSGAPLDRLVAIERLLGAGEAPAKLFALAAYKAPAALGAAGDEAIKLGEWDHEESLLSLAIN